MASGLLVGLVIDESAEFDQWLRRTQATLHDRLSFALGSLVRHYVDETNLARATDVARSWLSLDPWHEPAHRALMEIHALAGNRPAALRQYEECEDLLREQVGVSPSEETVLLRDRIRSGDGLRPFYDDARWPWLRHFAWERRSDLEPPASSVRMSPNNLSVPVTSLIGREENVAYVVHRLDDPTVRLLTLTGAGGTGKTRLAVRVAWAVLGHFHDGVWMVSLASVREEAQVLSTIAQVLGIGEPAPDAADGHEEALPKVEMWTSALEYYLRDRRVLLVLDNFEHVLGAAAAVVTLLTMAPGLKILATSRAPLGVYGEHLYPVLPLPVPNEQHPCDLAQLRDSPSIGLFVDRVRAVDGRFALTEENVSAVAAICRRLDGLPLAIELAAARARFLPPNAILARLDHRLDFLSDGPHNLPARQRTLRATIEWSYRLLSPDARRLFRQLAIFAGGFDADTIPAVCGVDDCEGVLAELIDHALVQPLQVVYGESRCVMLETIREYALERLINRGEEQNTRARHAQCYCAMAERAAPALYRYGPEEISWVRRLTEEQDNLRGALSWAVAHDRNLALRLAIGMGRYWQMRLQHAEGLAWCRQALLAPGSSEPDVLALRAEALRWAAWLADYVDRTSVPSMLQESLALFERLGDPVGAGRVLARLGETMVREGDIADGFACYERGIEMLRQSGDILPLIEALNSRADVTTEQHDARGALVYAEEAVELCHEIGADSRAAWSHYLLGDAYTCLGEHRRARELLEQGLEIARAAGDVASVVIITCYLGNVMAELGEHEFAEALYRECVSHESETALHPTYGWAYGYLADYARVRGETERAIELFERAYRVSEALKAPYHLSYITPWLGWVAMQRGNVAEAMAWCREGLQRAARREDPTGIRNALCVLALVLSAGEEAGIAACLMGAVDSITADLTVESAGSRALVTEITTALSAQLGREAASAALAEGRTIAVDGWRDAVRYALTIV